MGVTPDTVDEVRLRGKREEEREEKGGEREEEGGEREEEGGEGCISGRCGFPL
jgi:hypothetical protein